MDEIRISHVEKSYTTLSTDLVIGGAKRPSRTRKVLQDVNLTFPAGKLSGLVGRSGCGKSTLLKLLAGKEAPDAGEITLPEGWHTALLSPEPYVITWTNVRQNVAMASGVGRTPEERYEHAMEYVKLVGLEDYADLSPVELSTGMKQRLGLAMALLGSPDVLLLDEPFNGLDPEATRAMRNLIVRVNETSGITVVVSSHVLDQLDRMATRYGVIADGRMVREMTAEEVAAECRSSLRVRTENPARALALLEEAYPALAFKAEPDGAIVITGDYDDGAISRLLAGAGEVVRELSQDHRDLEEYFVELMEGGAQYV